MNSKLNWELAKEYYKLAVLASLSFYALLLITLYFYWGKLPQAILITWLVVNFIGASVFLVATRLFKRYGNEGNATQWLRAYDYLVLFQDAPWGLIGPMSFLIDNEVYRMLTLFMLGGMTAGAIVSRALVLKTYMISLFSLLTPIIITLALQHTPVADAMLALVVIYLLFLLTTAKHYSATIKRNILLWLDNEKLVGELRDSHAKLEDSNLELTQEIDHREQIQRELVEAKERSERANEAKNQFLATISHELRTPLNGVMGFADLLLDEQLEEKHKRHVDQISKSAHTLLHMVNDILDITAIEAGHINFHEENFSLRSELEDLMAIFVPMAERKELKLTLSVDAAVEDALCGDANRLRQIINNLISNALKYTEVGGVDFRISRLEGTHGRVALRFEVEDTGIGIEETALSTIFDNFTRVENFETRRNEGAGLGLAIVKTLVNKMDGKIDVQSRPGKGSRFSFDLTFKPGVETIKPAVPKQMPALSPHQWNDFNVLVVDDNDVNRMVLNAFLSKEGIPFSEAVNGYEALEQIRLGQFDLVLLDIQMPDISGIDVAMRLNATMASTPVLIAVTAHAFPEQRQAILDAGFADFLIKPIARDELISTLTQVYSDIQGKRDRPKSYLQA
jgi:signal transduction histidine kinase/ActR/RegA family two-component response regulator